jgi:phage terminase large subunit-like protein
LTPGEDGRLPYSEVVYSCPKKSGKTTIAALVMEYFGLFIEAPNEVYSCANDLEQAQSTRLQSVSVKVCPAE